MSQGADLSSSRKYRLILTLLDPPTSSILSSSPTSSSSHPLLPKTATLLPPSLDSQFRQSLPHLCLPTSIWGPFHPSRPLNSTAFSPKPVAAQLPSTTGIRSESSADFKPPLIATKALFTPSQAVQKAELDFRFGPITVDWVDNPTPLPPVDSPPLAPLSPGSPIMPGPSKPRKMSGSQSVGLSSTVGRGAVETSGTTDLNWGTIHLYRELGAEDEESTIAGKKAVPGGGGGDDPDDGTIVGMVSVPGNLTANTLLAFISPALESVMMLRVIRDSTPNRTIVLIKFRDATEAAQFKVMYNGRPFHETKDSEVCHVVCISSIKLKTTSTPPFTFPFSSDLTTKPEDVVELPTCPVCLERMDSNTSGLITVLCQHSFHCTCLLKWGDSRCPVCRSSNYRTRKPTLSTPATSRCTTCQSPSNLWICLICGNVGCGRYQGGHAHSHFTSSSHSYSMELETQRVWCYTTDAYVHRLIRNRTNNQLIELPSGLTRKPTLTLEEGDPEKDKTGPDRDTEENQDKLEAMGIEYAMLMTSQLDSQREYWESEIGRVKGELGSFRRKWEEGEGVVRKLKGEKEGWERRVEELEKKNEEEKKGWEKKWEIEMKKGVEEESRRKKEKLEWTKSKKDWEKELLAEKAVTKSLSENLRDLRIEIGKQEKERGELKAEMEDLKEQMRDVMMALEMRNAIEQEGGVASEAQGGDLVVRETTTGTPTKGRRKKK